MMSEFFHFQHILNRLFDNCIKLYWLDQFFLKYEGCGEGGGEGEGQIDPIHPRKNCSQKSSLIRVKDTRLKAFDVFKSKQKTDEVMFFYM